MFFLTVLGVILTVILVLVWRKGKFTIEVPDAPGSGRYGATRQETSRAPNRIFGIAAGVVGAITIVLLLFSTLYTQSVGEAKVITNFGGTVAGQDISSGVGAKAPWQSVENFDVFNQNLYYAGNADHVPEYVKGDRDGQEVTAYVNGGVPANIDVQISYNVNAESVEKIYRSYKSQERFIQQMTPNILSELRKVPPAYDPIPFRGAKKAEAEAKMKTALQTLLQPYGINVAQVALQDIRYPDEVETSIKQVQVAQQKQAEAEALQRAAKVDAETKVIAAQGEANAAIASARGQAEANAVISQSLTPQVLQQRYLDALKNGTVFVVPEGSNPLINVPAAPAK